MAGGWVGALGGASRSASRSEGTGLHRAVSNGRTCGGPCPPSLYPPRPETARPSWRPGGAGIVGERCDRDASTVRHAGGPAGESKGPGPDDLRPAGPFPAASCAPWLRRQTSHGSATR